MQTKLNEIRAHARSLRGPLAQSIIACVDDMERLSTSTQGWRGPLLIAQTLLESVYLRNGSSADFAEALRIIMDLLENPTPTVATGDDPVLGEDELDELYARAQGARRKAWTQSYRVRERVRRENYNSPATEERVVNEILTMLAARFMK